MSEFDHSCSLVYARLDIFINCDSISPSRLFIPSAAGAWLTSSAQVASVPARLDFLLWAHRVRLHMRMAHGNRPVCGAIALVA